VASARRKLVVIKTPEQALISTRATSHCRACTRHLSDRLWRCCASERDVRARKRDDV